MSKKDIQTERLLRYFLESTKNIIKSEGVDALTVRSIADNAGYSFGTLYKYFKDIKELVTQSGLEFIAECEEYVLENTPESTNPSDRIKFKSGKYIEYFVQYSGIYNLLFLSGKKSIGDIKNYNHALLKMHQNVFGTEFGSIFGDKSREMLDLFINIINGGLLLYNNRLYPETFSEFRQRINFQIEFLLK
ncbi:MAG: TetR/AcrR family transcriptional regulator [Candidatus Kapabacteria bacterium]|nr:TetR/AcrR family transcriptional regulator [Ignavibacteriota bacterium]MCW5885935.1 TetR/AcrR family transcriptional regulator [Candidatus Kapabacteria bacterium]